ncbi:hypothetical protein BO71DRAFT_424808 [Aspergillus ellipticus CBS 707.79]|uniref:Uncharacterized protein n=1 Tax=Aspergillus ellipticus CBS 707.79 TaxID=1448320 RepID=A0A319DQ72_9EURO|nr:hypothetical protein BO71DRAFT_424808 [Aspergillus ellipticus CBS 707.79]
MSTSEFMDDLGRLVNNHGMQDESVQWHESLAKAWVSKTDKIIFFPPVPGNVPFGLNIFEISPAAVDSRLKSYRAIFFEHAGAQAYNSAVVCDQIVERQTVLTRSWKNNQGSHRRLGESRVSELATQLYFLFKNKWTNDETRTLWVLNERRQPCPASAVYIPSNEADSAAIMLQGISPKVELLHKGYLGVGGEDKLDFIEWLRLSFGIWRVPRIATRNNDLSLDFQHVIQTASSIIWLCLLDKYFDQYADWLVPGGRKSKKVITSLRIAMVDCPNDEQAKIEETCRPGLERFLQRKCLLLDSEFGNWQLLANLGVIVGMDLRFYFSQLVHLKCTEPSEEKICQLYADIEANSEGSRDLIRSTFIKDSLIYVPSSKLKAGLKFTPKLKDLYPDNEILFKNILKIRNAGPELLLREIDECKPREAQDILQLLQDADSLWKDIDSFTLGMIKRLKIFPVRRPKQSDGFDLVSPSDPWLIPNKLERRYFSNDLPLLAFDYDAFDDMHMVRTVFDLNSRKLIATKEVFYAPNISKKMEILFTAKLYSVHDIFWALIVHHGGKTFTRGKGVAECLLEEDDEKGMEILISQNCIKYDMFPSELADRLSLLYKISERALAQDALTQVLAYVKEKLNNSGDAQGKDA